MAEYKDFYNLPFSTYLAGLIEGDGTIVVPKTERSAKGELNYASVQIVFHLKDLPLALIIQKVLGEGSLAKKKGVNAYILTINSYKGLVLIVSLLNGNMRTPKIESLYKLIDWLNNSKNTQFFARPLNDSPLTSNAWLSGFIEADASFQVRTTLLGKYPRSECKLEICQRQTDHNGNSNLGFLEKIAEFLLTTVKSVRQDRPNPEYRVRTVNLQGNLTLCNYLENNPLFGTKYLDAKDWMKVVGIFEKGEHKGMTGMEKIVKIKSLMNDRRTTFTWDHLQDFYNLKSCQFLMRGAKQGCILPQSLSARRHYSTNSSVVPVKTYSNADLDKESIITENKGKSGIYLWVNLNDRKAYVGSSVNLGVRLRKYYSYYYLTEGSKGVYISRALLKYGYSGFKLEILEYCDPEKCLEREQYYLDNLKPKYNVLLRAGSP